MRGQAQRPHNRPLSQRTGRHERPKTHPSRPRRRTFTPYWSSQCRMPPRAPVATTGLPHIPPRRTLVTSQTVPAWKSSQPPEDHSPNFARGTTRAVVHHRHHPSWHPHQHIHHIVPRASGNAGPDTAATFTAQDAIPCEHTSTGRSRGNPPVSKVWTRARQRPNPPQTSIETRGDTRQEHHNNGHRPPGHSLSTTDDPRTRPPFSTLATTELPRTGDAQRHDKGTLDEASSPRRHHGYRLSLEAYCATPARTT